MLNELLIVERGARQAGIEMAQRHPDIKDARRIPTLTVRLDEKGRATSVRLVVAETTLWTLRDGQHNSFPFIQPKPPLWTVHMTDQQREAMNDRKSERRRALLLSLADEARFNAPAFADWPGAGLLDRLRERREQVASLLATEASAVPAAIDRFLVACDLAVGGDPAHLLENTVQHLVAQLRETADARWVDVAFSLLLGRYNPKTVAWECDGALLMDAEGDWRSVGDAKMIGPVSEAIRAFEAAGSASKSGCCGLTGEVGPLVESKFPQPNLRVLGQTFLFARNRDTPANGRYGRFSADSMPVGQDVVIRLAAAVAALTSDDRNGVTWRMIPGAAPKQSDLLLAFIDAVPDAPVAGALTQDDAEEDLAEEAPETASDRAGSIAGFEKRTERLIEAVQAKVKVDFTRTPVRLAVLRKVDPANRKIVYAGEMPVKDYCSAATNWAAGERNVPPWVTLPVLRKGEHKVRPISPPHVAPLGVITFTKQLFVRGGTERQEVVGLSASEALGLFLEHDQRRARRVLRLVLARRTALVSGTAHALRRGFDAAKEFDRGESLRTITLLGVLLHKLNQAKEDYMRDTAFRLGQLLAAADVLHAGYCADVRGGDVPPSLLGNQVFAMAQVAPTKALATLCRRWKPYDGWAKKASREPERVEQLRGKAERRYWDIRKALRHAREMQPLADELGRTLAASRVTDTFRAELLLGYIAGLPKAQKNDEADEDQATQNT